MQNELDSKWILDVYETIQKCGQDSEQGKVLEGVHASTDFDGYTVILQDNQVCLTLGFHQTYKMDYQSDAQKDTFIKRLKHIMQEHAHQA